MKNFRDFGSKVGRIVDTELESGSILYTVYMMEGGVVDGLYWGKNGGQNRQKWPKRPIFNVSPYSLTNL